MRCGRVAAPVPCCVPCKSPAAGREYLHEADLGGVGCRPTGRRCDAPCGGELRDTVLDWDTPLPEVLSHVS
jgi:hypothetical protein